VRIDAWRAFFAHATAAVRSCELQETRGRDHGFFDSHAIDCDLRLSPHEGTSEILSLLRQPWYLVLAS
jgi:hypothetical protein